MKRINVFILIFVIVLMGSLVFHYLQPNKCLASDLLPSKPMVKIFKNKGHDKWNVELIDVISDDKIQVREIRAKLCVLNVYDKTNANEINLVYTDFFKVALFAESYLNEESNIMTIYIKGPIALGTKWQYYGNTSEITNTSVEITTPVGTFNAVEVTITSNKNNSKAKMYFTKGIGIVKITGENYSIELISIDYETKFTGLDEVFKYVDDILNL